MAEAPAGFAPSGLMHGQRAMYSQETKNLLKTMMNESKLTNIQQRQLDKAVKEGAALPKTCNSASNAKSRQSQSQKKIVGKVLNPRNYSSRVRKKEQIEQSGAYEREQFAPAPMTKFGGKYEKDKERLANIMAFGEEVARDMDDAKSGRRKQVQRAEPPKQPPVDRFAELQNEIEERRQFIADMRALGRANEYEKIIETEISQMLREMELIDRKQNAELERRIREEEGERMSSGRAVRAT